MAKTLPSAATRTNLQGADDAITGLADIDANWGLFNTLLTNLGPLALYNLGLGLDTTSEAGGTNDKLRVKAKASGGITVDGDGLSVNEGDLGFIAADGGVIEGDLDLGDSGEGKMHIEQDASAAPGLQVIATHGAFADAVIEGIANRDLASGFDLLRLTADVNDVKMRCNGFGQVTADISFTGGGADYAEMFEWKDGNPAGEDRIGRTVVIEDGLIRLAQPGEEPVGAISATYSMLGNAAALGWHDRYVRDAFGRVESEEIQIVEWTEKVTASRSKVMKTKDKPTIDRTRSFRVGDERLRDIPVPATARRRTISRPKENPAYDPARPYVARLDRPEWDPVGLLGQVRILKGQPVGNRWIRIGAISETVELWLVR